jgi:hypothetical protein
MLLFTHQLDVLKKVMASAYGWLIATGTSVAAFFAPEKYAFGLVLIAILLDAFFGTWVSLRNGNFFLSKLGRVTSFKILSYGASLVMVFMVEKLAHDSGFVGVKVAAAWAVACEFWSMSASILIIWPDAAFFRIMRRHLKGEIAAKLGQQVEDILPESKK